MNNKSIVSVLLVGLFQLLLSCKTYYIPVESFKEQLSGFDDADMKEVTTQFPYIGRATYKTYPIDSIHAVDKSGTPVTLKNGPSIEVRITDTLNKKTVFYFDLIRFDGINITGGRSRILPLSLEKKIPIEAVKTIEVQDGKKKFRYLK